MLALTAIGVLPTVAFGGRFDKRMHRGAIANGPYRDRRRCADLGKGLSWCWIAMHFMAKSQSNRTAPRTEERQRCLDPA